MKFGNTDFPYSTAVNRTWSPSGSNVVSVIIFYEFNGTYNPRNKEVAKLGGTLIGFTSTIILIEVFCIKPLICSIMVIG